MTAVLTAILAAGSFLAWTAGVAARFLRGRRDLFWGFCLLAYCLQAVANVIAGNWGWLAFDIAGAASSLWFWDEQRRKRGRRGAASLIGEKTRAIRDGLLRKARESAKPSPVLKPSLRGAS